MDNIIRFSKKIITHLEKVNFEFPMVISRSENKLNNHQYHADNQIVELRYSYSKRCFCKSDRNISSNANFFTYLLNSILDSIKRNNIYVRVKQEKFNVDKINFGANQIQLIDYENHIIMHVLIPGVDNEWFLKDIETRKKINSRFLNLKCPQVYESNRNIPYFITIYINGVHPTELTDNLYDEITSELFKFYSEQNELIKKDIKSEIELVIKKINEQIAKYDKRLTENFRYTFSNLITRIENSDYCIESQDHVIYVDIVHGDMNYLENIIRSADDRTLYFLDWELSRSANILYDFFYFLIYEIAVTKKFHGSHLAKVFGCKKKKKLLQEKIKKYLDISIKESQFVEYFNLTILDMLLHKILIIKKKRAASFFTASMIKNRFKNFEVFFYIANQFLELIERDHDIVY